MSEKIQNKLKLPLAVGAACFLLFYLDGILPRKIFWGIYYSKTFHIVILLFLALYFLVRRFRDGIEIRLLLYYCLWALLSRIILKESLAENWRYLAELSLMIVTFIPGVILQERPQQREKLIQAVGAIVLLVLAIPGILAVYSAATHKTLYSPFMKMSIGYLEFSWRISVFSVHPNTVAGIYLAAFCLAFILLFRTEKRWIHCLMVLSAILSFIVIALTASRNGQTWASMILGLTLALVLCERFLPDWRGAKKNTALFLVAVIICMASYQLYEPIRSGTWKIYETTRTNVEAKYEATEACLQQVDSYELRPVSTGISDQGKEMDSQYHPDTRGYFDSQRKILYWSALKSLQLEPRRILIGSPVKDVMDISYSLIPENHWDSNFHNVFLDVINHFGAPALILVIIFYLLMIRYGMQLYFAEKNSFSIQEKLLVLPVVAFMGFHLLESTFIGSDFCGLFLFYSCGMLTGTCRMKNKGINLS